MDLKAKKIVILEGWVARWMDGWVKPKKCTHEDGCMDGWMGGCKSHFKDCLQNKTAIKKN